MKNARSIVVTGLAVIAAVVVLGVWKGYIPPKAGTEGAIGAAQRYSSPQITDSDVRLSDPSVQAFLQSDLFHAIATNPDFRNVVTKDAFKKAVQVEGMLDVVAQDYGHGGKDFNQLVASEDFQNLTASEDFSKAIKDQNVQKLIANEDFQKLVGRPDFQKYVAEQLKGAGKDAKNSRVKDESMTKSKEWLALTSNEDYGKALSNHDFLAATANTDLAKLIQEHSKLFASEDFNKMLGSQDFRNLVASEDYQKLAASPEYLSVLANEDFQKAASQKEFQKLVRGGDLAAAVASEDMGKTTTKDMSKATSEK